MKNAKTNDAKNRISRSGGALVAVAFAALTLGTSAAHADGASGSTLTCEKIKQNCMARVARDASRIHAASDGIERPHLTTSDCESAYSQARSTGVWPEHLPYFFAAQCSN
jgi:hypothetical protein